MEKPRPKKIKQKDFVQRTVRLPPPLFQEMYDISEQQVRSFNSIIIERCSSSEIKSRLNELSQEVAELKRMIKQLLDK